MRWTEGYLAASQRPWRRRPRRGRSAWHACGWVSREPGRPRRLHRTDRRGAGTGSPRPRPWTSAPGVRRSEAAGARMVPPGEGNDARGDGRRGVGVSHSTAEAGELSPRDPVEGRGHRQVAPVEGKTANTPRLGPVSTSRQRIAELARQALGMAVAIAGLPGPAGTRRRVAKPSVEEPDAAGSSRQGCNPAGASPAVSIAQVGHVAMPHPGMANHPGDAWCKRPGRPARRCCGGCNLGA